MLVTSTIHVHHLHVFITVPRGVRSVYADLTRYVCKHDRDGLVSECREVLGRNELQNNFTNGSPVETWLSNISTGITRKPSAFHLRALAGIHNLFGIDCVLVHLLFHDLSVFSDQEVHAARRLVFVFVDSVFVGYFAAPVTQQPEGYTNLVGEG